MGMIDRVAEAGKLRGISEEEARRLTQSTGRTAALLKAQMKQELYSARDALPDNGPFLDAWYSPETQRRLGEVLARLKNGGSA
jgi:hypothetical protein